MMYAAIVPPAALLAAEEGEPNPLLPHLSELIVGIVAFGLLYLFLSRKVFPIFERTFAQRTEAIEGGIARAEAAQAEARAALEQYRAQLADARGEASQIRAEAQSERKNIVEAARVEAQQAAAQVAERTRAQLQADVTQARAQLSRDVGRIAVDLAGRVVGENLADTDRTRATVDRFLTELETTSAVPSRVPAGVVGAGPGGDGGRPSGSAGGPAEAAGPATAGGATALDAQ